MENLTKRDIQDTIWSVFTSFGINESETENNDLKKYFILDKGMARLYNTSKPLAKAETVAALTEALFALGINEFKISISEKDIFDYLDLFGFENIIKLDNDIKDGFSLITDHTEVGYGNFEENRSFAKLDIKKISKILEASDNNVTVSKSLVYSEKDAEGLAYDLCYNLRVNGCIVELYSESEDIKAACEYAKAEGHACILRCYKDGTLEIKDIVKNEITKTTVLDFLGYYEEDDECDCGHDHHHEHHDDCCSGHCHH